MSKSAQDLLSPWKRTGSQFAEALVTWYRSHRRDWPWRTKFVEHGDPYYVWVSEIMLQQTTIQAVLPAYHRFLDNFPNLFRLSQGTEDQIRQACRGLGYYRRFRMLHEAAKVLTAGMRSEQDPVPWPRDFISWKALPGIGDYTAAAIASIAFGVPKAVVDGNVERVFCRLFNLQVVPDQKWKKVFQGVGDTLIPHDAPSDFNQGLMELGQAICIKQNPKCSICPVQNFCEAYAKGTQALAPAAKNKMVFEELRIHLFIVEKRGRLGLLQRKPSAKFLKGSWSFPNAIEASDQSLLWETDRIRVGDAKRLGVVKHGITKHKLEVVVSKVDVDEDYPGMRWFGEDEVEEALVSNMDRKALRLFLKVREKTPLDVYFS
ncbi:MAG: A/G-specific adenine glycosylase [Chitinophagaceae bacterium]|nr:A/G-specific adenine glycosylase [Oligoflexus sp.]